MAWWILWKINSRMLGKGSILGRKILGGLSLWSLGRWKFVEVWWHLDSRDWELRGSRSSSIFLLDWKLALTLLQLSIVDGILYPSQLSIVDGILYPSSTITQLSKRTNRQWQKPTIICRKQVLDNHVDLIFLIWPINHPRCLSLPPCHVFEECFPYSLLSGLQVS